MNNINVNPIISCKQNNIPVYRHSQNSKSLTNLSFGGLKTAMGKQVHNSPETLQAMMGIYKSDSGIVGTLPREMILALKNNGVEQMDMSEKIKTITTGISEAVKTLREAEIAGAELANSFDVLDFMNKISELAVRQDIEGIQKLANSLYGMDAIPENDMKELEKCAATTIGDAFKKEGILPSDGYVIVERLGNGAFGNAFKVSFRDAEDKKVFHDKVIKVFKDAKTEETAIRNLAKKSLEYFSDMSVAEYVEYSKKNAIKIMEAMRDQMGSVDMGLTLEMFEEMFEESKPILEKFFEKQKNMSLDDHVKQYREQMQGMKAFHGVTAEANRAMFLKSIAGNMSETDYVEQHFYDLKNEYAFVEMADDELPPVKRKLDLEKHRLCHNDLGLNVANTVRGRVVDIGGITTPEQLAKAEEAQAEQVEEIMKNFGF